MKKIRKSVSALLLYEDKIFIIKRSNSVLSFPGYTSFPGGKVEAGETLKIALLRELKEELGTDIEKYCSRIYEWTEATSPDFNPRRFQNTYFKIELNELPDFNVDTREFSEYRWIKIQTLIQEYQEGKHLFVTPMLPLLKNINDDTFKYIRKNVELPVIEPLSGLLQYMPLSNTLPPANRTNMFVIGEQKKIVIDPSPKDKEEYEKVKKLIKNLCVNEIFLTHHHGDHHQYSNNLAKDLNIPIGISLDSKQRIERKNANYFDKIQIKVYSEGMSLCHWKNQEVNVYEIPGHDEGHLGLAPKNMKWFIAGDLFQGVGSVVVGGEEGNMKKYMASLKKVIALKPDCVIPSHGIALGGTAILEKNLRHRQLREKQILELLMKGRDQSEILDIIYVGLDPRLKPFALANIKSHIEKIKEEKLLPI